MTISFLPAAPRRKGTGEKLMQGLGMAAQSIPDLIGQYQKDKERQAFMQKFGMGKQQQQQASPIYDESKKEELFPMLAAQYEQQTGEQASPEKLDALWEQLNMQGQQQQPQSEYAPHEQQILAAELMKAPEKQDLAGRLSDIHKQRELSTGKAYQMTQKYRSGVQESAAGAKTTNAILDRMKQLNQGKLAGPFKATMAKMFDVPISVLSNPQSEEFDKLSNTLSREVSKIFRGRILQSEFENFLKQIPTLQNSKQGRDRIIELMRIMNSPQIEEQKMMKKIISENGGKTPMNIEDEVADRMSGHLDNLADQFRQISSSQTASGKPKKALDKIFTTS